MRGYGSEWRKVIGIVSYNVDGSIHKNNIVQNVIP